MHDWVENNFRLVGGLGFPILFILGAGLLPRGVWRWLCTALALLSMASALVLIVMASYWKALLWPVMGTCLWIFISDVRKSQDGFP